MLLISLICLCSFTSDKKHNKTCIDCSFTPSASHQRKKKPPMRSVLFSQIQVMGDQYWSFWPDMLVQRSSVPYPCHSDDCWMHCRVRLHCLLRARPFQEAAHCHILQAWQRERRQIRKQLLMARKHSALAREWCLDRLVYLACCLPAICAARVCNWCTTSILQHIPFPVWHTAECVKEYACANLMTPCCH